MRASVRDTRAIDCGGLGADEQETPCDAIVSPTRANRNVSGRPAGYYARLPTALLSIGGKEEEEEEEAVAE